MLNYLRGTTPGNHAGLAADHRIAVEVIPGESGKARPGNSDGSARFETRHRLRKGHEFKAVFEHRQRFHSPYFSFHQLPNCRDWHRVGLAVSRKVSKKAVERNRIKRQVRESFRQFQRHCEVDPGAEPVSRLDFVVVAKPAAAAATNQALRKDLDRAWPRCCRGDHTGSGRGSARRH